MLLPLGIYSWFTMHHLNTSVRFRELFECASYLTKYNGPCAVLQYSANNLLGSDKRKFMWTLFCNNSPLLDRLSPGRVEQRTRPTSTGYANWNVVRTNPISGDALTSREASFRIIFHFHIPVRSQVFVKGSDFNEHGPSCYFFKFPCSTSLPRTLMMILEWCLSPSLSH
jgi:hypothetical protein